ncbi:helix-hairpin-helix domain-containing protein [Alkalibacterium sp. MB6]|uniref:helix-hairpin-helix domain-containing protein n=1 Tax=Alkalibacterium sp. MB6 TaxID=2081965 RepID=UPI00137AA4B3|nr:helix-hairpin-helix domain-containing protein [Alkalibacterium sp. MB6]
MDTLNKLKEYKGTMTTIVAVLVTAFVVSLWQDKPIELEQPEEAYLDDLLLPEPVETNQLEDTPEGPQEELVHAVFIDVKGAVNYPGVYELDTSKRIIDAIAEAGGLVDEADTKGINFAKQLTDEMLLYIPVEGEEPPVIQEDATTEEEVPGKININTAPKTELEQLSGIGPQKALAIIKYRETEGLFKTIEDVMNVSGIGEKTFEGLKEEVVVD